MKLIDADKLKAEIEGRRLQNRYIDTDGYEQELFEIIDSLQQEQQEEPASNGYDEAYLNEKITKASKTWEGVDVDKYMDEVRGREPNKSMEEAAKEYSEGPECTWVGTTALEEAFKAGASWQKQQMLKDAVEATVMDFSSNHPRPQIDVLLDPHKYHTGDKVRIIIVKAEEE